MGPNIQKLKMRIKAAEMVEETKKKMKEEKERIKRMRRIQWLLDRALASVRKIKCKHCGRNIYREKVKSGCCLECKISRARKRSYEYKYGKPRPVDN